MNLYEHIRQLNITKNNKHLKKYKNILEKIELIEYENVSAEKFLHALLSPIVDFSEEEITPIFKDTQQIYQSNFIFKNQGLDMNELYICFLLYKKILYDAPKFSKNFLEKEENRQLENNLHFLRDLLKEHCLEKILAQKNQLLEYVKENYQYGETFFKAHNFFFSTIDWLIYSFDKEEKSDIKYFLEKKLITYLSEAPIDEQHISVVRHLDELIESSTYNLMTSTEEKNFNDNLYDNVYSYPRVYYQVADRLSYVLKNKENQNIENCIRPIIDNIFKYEEVDSNNKIVKKMMDLLDHKNKIISFTSQAAFCTLILYTLPLSIYYVVSERKKQNNLNRTKSIERQQKIFKEFGFLNNNAFVFAPLHRYFNYLSEDRKDSITRLIQEYSSSDKTNLGEMAIDNNSLIKIEQFSLNKNIKGNISKQSKINKL